MKRTKLIDRLLPDYTSGEECMNMVTHIVGGGIAVLALIGCCLISISHYSLCRLLCALTYGISMVTLYSMSSIYHGLRPGTAKKVLQVLDHCTIYFLIAGTYTPIALVAIRPEYPLLGWGLIAFQWGLTALAVTLTAIDLKKYNVFSMICYICMGWAILPFMPQARSVLGEAGFGFLLSGGIAYTIGAILYGIGSKKRWFHSIFHIFVVLGSALQLICILFYVL
ncbi:MAG: hemolysin III family protein [Oscillospiraceae bacterium]|nr:hemolysin III family protein [Oscillospiraceae bacterium]